MDQVKEAFKKVKEDMDLLRKEILELNQEIKSLKERIDSTKEIPTQVSLNPINSDKIPTDSIPQNVLKHQNMTISTGNEGVPTDKQTNRQTNQQTQNNENSMENALKVLNSLDNIKKEIRLKFKDLTEQEFLIFSTLYQLDDIQGNSDYKTLSEKLNLSESSVRDYVGKLIKKGIPVEKVKIKNKNIKLSISHDLKKIVSLSTIFQLREL